MIDLLLRIVHETWWVFLAAAPYVVLGLIAAAIIYSFFPKEKIQQALGKSGIGSILKASLLGIPLPLCSCGVLPTALSLRERGASRGATVSFLVSTPETGLDSIAVTYALINPAMTVLRPVAAFVSAVAAGIGVDRFGRDRSENNSAKPVCSCCGETACETDHPWIVRMRGAAKYIVNDFFPDIANWIVLGLIVSGIVAALVPDDFLARVPGVWQLILAVVAGVPIYICASASTPIAAVLMAKGISPGAALVFLLVGPATNLASLLVLGHRMGKRTAVVYLLILVLTSLLIGLAVDTFMGGLDWTPKLSAVAAHEGATFWEWTGTVLLLIGLVHVWRRQILKRLRAGKASAPPGIGTISAHS